MTRMCSRVSFPGLIDGFLVELFWNQPTAEYPYLTWPGAFLVLRARLQQKWLAAETSPLPLPSLVAAAQSSKY